MKQPATRTGPLTTAATRQSRAAEAGFTLVELTIALVVIGVVLAAAIPSFAGARGSVNSQAAIAAAAQYKLAIDAFARDHGGRLPVFGSTDWPDPGMGPVRPTGQPYLLGGVPSVVESRHVVLADHAPDEPIASAWLHYERLDGYRYRIVLLAGPSVDRQHPCTFGSDHYQTNPCLT